jgi:TetR/AcrR family transcriptional repressor of mexJK operon
MDPAKREAILVAAETVFTQEGYGASMDRIALVAGVSKQTIYKHFESKDALFDAMVRRRGDALLEPITTMGPNASPAAVLTAQGERFLELLTKRHYPCLVRVIIAAGTQAQTPDIGPHFYENGPRLTLSRMADYLRRQSDAGHLRIADPMLAAEQFFGLVNGQLQLRTLLGQDPNMSPDQMKARAREAVRVFMAAYGPEN